MHPTDTLLHNTLAVAVPLWIEELKTKPPEHVQWIGRKCGRVIAEKGDVILYQSKKKGKTAYAFNRLAQGMACLALIAKDGVEMFGLHFDAEFVKK